jgi:hypothetical protein
VILAGPDFRPGSGIRRLLPGSLEQAQVGSSTPQLTSEGRILPWFDESVIDLAGLPPFTGVRATSLTGTRHEVWLVAQENQTPLMVAARAGKGRVVYVAGYPLWRWGFGSRVNPPLRTALATFLSGVVRYLAERDTSPFRLSTDKPAYFRGEPVRLTLHAVGPDGRPWSKLSAVVAVRPAWDTGPAKGQSPVFETVPVLPMTETGDGVYQAVCEALEHGAYNATASVSRGDSLLGRASLSFAVAEQSIELARTGMDGGLLRAIAGASGGWFYPSESLPHEGVEIALGSYQRRFVFDPRRAVLAYVVVALLAGAEWFLRRRKGLL